MRESAQRSLQTLLQLLIVRTISGTIAGSGAVITFCVGMHDPLNGKLIGSVAPARPFD